MRQKLFGLVVLWMLSHSQEVVSQDFARNYQLPITTQILELDSLLSINEVIELSETGQFYSTLSLSIARPRVYYWFEIDFSSHSKLISDLDSLIFYPSGIEKGSLYLWQDSGFSAYPLDRFGENSLQKSEGFGPFFIPIHKNQLYQGSKIFVQAEFVRATPDLSDKKFYFSDPPSHYTFSKYISQSSFKSQVLAYFFLGVAFVLLVFNLILFFYMRDRQYIYYGLFIFFQLIYYSQISPSLARFFGYEQAKLFFWITTVSQVLINLSYLMFIRHFLNFKEKLPGFDSLVQALAWGLMGFVIVMGSLVIINPYSQLQADLMNVQRIFMASFAFFGVGYLWWKYPDKLVWFVITGTIVFTSGALCTMFLLDLNYMVTGSAVESTIFALGLSYKIKMISSEKQKAEIEIYQTKLGALRAQINPHFIFNSLASIQHLISSGQNHAALRYLSKFSKFVRQVLENSIDIHITLEKEVELLKVYLDLESLRFDQAFNYYIEWDSESKLGQEEVPMLIVQPFVENAIKHGLIPKTKGEKKLYIRFRDDGRFILCEVEDNGLGISVSRAQKSKNAKPSRGMMLTKERLKMVYLSNKQEELIQIKDLHPGTLVLIKIPKL